MLFNPLPNDKISDWSNFKAFAVNKIYVPEKLKFYFWKGRKYYGERRKGWLPAFSPFPIMSLMSGLSGKELNGPHSNNTFYCQFHRGVSLWIPLCMAYKE